MVDSHNAVDIANRPSLLRVLGLTPRASMVVGDDLTKDDDKWAARVGAARDRLDQAVAEVNGQIQNLRAVLRNSGDESLKAIAEFGLPSVTGNLLGPVLAAVRELGGEIIPESDTDKILALIEACRNRLASDEQVAACDQNPFGVSVSIRTTLDPPLNALAAVIQQAKSGL